MEEGGGGGEEDSWRGGPPHPNLLSAPALGDQVRGRVTFALPERAGPGRQAGLPLGKLPGEGKMPCGQRPETPSALLRCSPAGPSRPPAEPLSGLPPSITWISFSLIWDRNSDCVSFSRREEPLWHLLKCILVPLVHCKHYILAHSQPRSYGKDPKGHLAPPAAEARQTPLEGKPEPV